jgi:hypothetical protein
MAPVTEAMNAVPGGRCGHPVLAAAPPSRGVRGGAGSATDLPDTPRPAEAEHRAHRQLDGPILLVWDLNTHVSAATPVMVDARDWLHEIRLPAYAPDLSPTEGVWSHLKRSIGNLAVTGVDHLLAIIKNPAQEHSVPYRPARRVPRPHRPDPGLTLEPDTT